MPSISAGTEIRDLGVIAVAGKRRKHPVSAARVQLACGRFARIRRLPVPFRWRCLMAAAAGTAAGTYGSSCGRPAARELEQLRRAAKAATGHGPRAAAEIMFGVLSPAWRLDPKAAVVVAPLLQAARALRAGQLDLASWRNTAAAVNAGAARAVGPVAAALRSLRELGLGDDMECWAGVPAAPHGWRPAEQTRRSTERVVMAAWSRAECRKVAARRPCFAHLAGGVDKWATRRLLAADALAPEAAGALRSVMCGSIVTEAVAAKWKGDAGMCPHCGLAPEDHEHRLWRCPAWEGVRRAALATAPRSEPLPLDVLALRQMLPEGVALSGILPMPPLLGALAEAAGSEDPLLPPQAALLPDSPRRTVWSDGACLYPDDPLLARAAWGLRCEGVDNPNFAGPVDGQQTAQRAEVTAALAAARVVGGPIDLASDSQYVVRACAKIVAGTDVREWEHADLWQHLVDAVRSGRLQARWVPAHKTPAEARRLGMSERDRLGNAAADGNAGAAAALRAPPPGLVRTRRRELELLGAAQRVLAAAQQAALAAAPPAARRRRRDWRQVRRGTRARATSAPAGAAPAGRAAHPAARPRRSGDDEPVGSGAMIAAFFAGRSWWPHTLAQGPGQVVCLRCGGCAPTRATMLERACPGWTDRLPVSGQALLLLGELRCAGGSVADFARLVAQRIAQLPKVPD